MFLELRGNNQSGGWIEVITGSMFSGKTEELIRRINRVKIANLSVEVFKPTVDTRYAEDKIVSHAKRSMGSIIVSQTEGIEAMAKNLDVVAIDEAQFFDEALVPLCTSLANQGKRVIVAGLDMDFNGQPFGPVPHLMAIAEFVTKLQAICTQCGQLAHYSFRKSNIKEKILVGGHNTYIPLCRSCFLEKNQKQ
jgi:thymidine kinase